MREKYSLFTVLSLLFLWVIPAFAQTEFEPLPIDPTIRYGKLSNGITYYIRHNELPKERADFYIVQNVGSILEDENQRGLAHFLEHMAFDGTKNFPDDGISEFTERIGIRFGENLNAYTGFDETVYMIMNAPVTVEQDIDSCLLVLHDWSGFITLADSAIEKERGVIREEWRTRQDATMRLWEQQLPKLYPDNRYAYRLPIGTIDVIDNFKPDELRAYYKKWYRPDLQAVIIVGDIDTDQIEGKIKQLFSDIPMPEKAAERIWYQVDDNKEPLVSVATDKEATNLFLHVMHKYDKVPNEVMASVNGLAIDYIKSISVSILNERLNELTQKANPPFIFAGNFDGDYMVSKTKGAWTIAASVKDNDIKSAMDALITETERVNQYGFTEAEYDRARINLLKSYETAYNEREKQRNATYSRAYVDHFTEGGALPGIELEYSIIQAIAPQIQVEQVNEYFNSIIGDENIVISITGPDKSEINYPSENTLLEWFREARQIPVEPYVEELSNEPLIENLPAPGKILKTIQDPLFDATVMELSNGATVVLKHTEFKQDEIRMTGTSPGGTILFGDEEYANLEVFNEVIGLGGLGNFSAIDLGKVLAGKKAGASTALGLSNENVNGSAVPADIETLFQLIYLNFTAKRMDEQAFESYIGRLKAYLQNIELNPMVAFNDTVRHIFYNDNIRMKRLTPADLDKVSYARIMEMYRERYADASDFVFTFVGNLNVEEMRPLIERYIASLPSLNRKDIPDAAKVVTVQRGNHASYFKKQMEVPKATVLNFFPGKLDYNLENNITATFLKQILDLVYTEKIRKDEGATYGVSTNFGISQFPEGEAYLQTTFDTDPEKWRRMNEIIYEEIDRIAKEGPRPEDFNKTKENMLKRYAENQQENVYWLNALDNYYYRNYDGVTNYKETLESITPQKIQSLLSQLLNQNNKIEVIMEGEQ